MFENTSGIINVLALAALAFIVAIGWTPVLTKFLYKFRAGKQIRDSASAPIYAKLHQHKAGTPTMGGVLIWATVLFLAVLLYWLSAATDWFIFDRLNFLNPSETLL